MQKNLLYQKVHLIHHILTGLMVISLLSRPIFAVRYDVGRLLVFDLKSCDLECGALSQSQKCSDIRKSHKFHGRPG